LAQAAANHPRNELGARRAEELDEVHDAKRRHQIFADPGQSENRGLPLATPET
jgi:hypothetical protein